MTDLPRLDRRSFAALTAGAALAASHAAPPTALAQGTSPTGAATTGTTGATAAGQPFAMLIDEHRQVADLLRKMSQSQESAARMQQVKQLKQMLTAHAVAEENALYPALRLMADEEGDARDAFREHAEMKVALFDLEMAARTGQGWDDKLRTLSENISQHVQEEESDIFPELRKKLEAAQLQMIERQIQENHRLVG